MQNEIPRRIAMRFRQFAIIACTVLYCGWTVQAQTAGSQLTVIRAGTLIDGTSDAALHNKLVFVRGDRIERVADANAALMAASPCTGSSAAT